jgi:hypothetical protein
VIALRQAILSILDMTLRFRDALTGDVDLAPTIARALPRIRSRLHRSRRKHQERKDTIGLTVKSWVVTQSSDSDSEPEEEEPLGSSSLVSVSHNYRVPPLSRDGQQLFGDIYGMQDELDKLVCFVHREVEGLAGCTSVFNVLAFALEDWGQIGQLPPG